MNYPEKVLPLQKMAFINFMNSELFEDEFNRLTKKEQLKIVKNLIDLAGYITVSNKPKSNPYEWIKMERLAHEYVYKGKLPKKIYNRWAAIWKIISTQTYAATELKIDLPGKFYQCQLTIWGKNPPVDLPLDAKIFVPTDNREFRLNTCQGYFDDIILHVQPSSINIRLYNYARPSGLFALISSALGSWYCTEYSLDMVLKSNEHTKYLQQAGYDVSEIPELPEELNSVYR